MALYRMYKNGIYGRRYKTRYIVKQEDFYCVYLDKDKLATNEKFPNMEEAEWWISKDVATEEEMKLMNKLYAQEIYVLSDLMLKYMDMEKVNGLSKEQKKDYELLTTIRGRKAKDKPF